MHILEFDRKVGNQDHVWCRIFAAPHVQGHYQAMDKQSFFLFMTNISENK
jgi:hypothetical protein